MKDRWALITGSSQGLGLEIALKLAQSGFRMVITGRNHEKLSRAIEELNSVSGAVHLSVCMDLVEDESPAKLREILADYGVSPSIIVNNLGGGVPGDRRNIPLDILRAAMRLNLEVGVEINNLFYDDLKKNQGIVVHIGSTASLHYDAPPGYVISKSAINAYVKNAARSFAKDNICIWAILPGILMHDGSYADNLKLSDPDRHEKFLSQSIFGRFTKSSEVAEFIANTIISPTMMLNGSLVQFDGGKE